MTDSGHRAYTVVVALVLFCVTWAAVAARPWATAAPDVRMADLALREQRLRADAKLVERIVTNRQAAYSVSLARRQAEIARRRATASLAAAVPARAAPVAARIVELPPVTTTRSS
jgi:hypothetical protein